MTQDRPKFNMSQRSSAVRSQLLGEFFTETDLNKLQLQYRRSEAVKRAYSKNTRVLIYRHRREIQRLQDERDKLLRNLGVSQTSCSSWTDGSTVQDLTSLLACGDRLDEELRAEKDKVASLKDQISKWERKLVGKRATGGTTCHSWKSDNRNLVKTTCLTENKLDRGCKCFNELMTRNGQLREDLKTLQMEKKHFLHVQSQRTKELHAIRKDICNMMTKCTEAFNASVKIQEKLRILMDQNAKDMAQYIKERRGLERGISHYCNFKAFLDIKTIVRMNQEIDHSQVEKCKELGSKEWALEDFEDAMKKIFRETAESDLDKLVRNFIQMEGQNYTLLNFVNYQHNEAETIQDRSLSFSVRGRFFQLRTSSNRNVQQVRQMKVSIKQEATDQQLPVYKQRVQFMEKLLDQLKEGVKSLLQISYNNSEIFDQLSSSDGVQDEDVTEYLKMVEDRVNELLALQSYLHFQESQWDIDSLNTIASQLLGITPPSVSLTTAAATPAPGNDPDLVESVLLDAKEPLSRDDLLTLVNKKGEYN
ncbi:outer dynein arm-docking complex subunit 1 isoform X1 [Lates calcarifer]|uniref:Outer dynein arm-docking complex subunit 1 isoform X1 n=2 Tax=Lates calcarifer TaxID=8187 RepID=A0AAJ8B653_LATCA|nr:outer dynein arm-docking complex subunit 1 isoform X1 [Lates calcarifer]